MTGESNPNPKKLKIEKELTDDGQITIITSQEADYGTFIEEGFIFIELQGEESVNRKLNRIFHIGDQVVLLRDIPEDRVYKGCLCTIISVFGEGEDESPDNTFYEIQFDSYFKDNDLSRKSQKRHRDFEFPSSTYVTIVSGKDIVRLINQDLLYKTWFA